MRRFLLSVALLPAGLLSVTAQLRSEDSDTFSGILLRAQHWMKTGAYHVARLELGKIVDKEGPPGKDRDVLLLLTKADVEDGEYEDAYQRAAEFLSIYPNDPDLSDVRFMHGVSAFQTERSQNAIASLTSYLNSLGDRRRFGEAYFWLAMSKLDVGDQAGAQNDLELCYNNASDLTYRDYALMGFALALERKKEFARASERLDELLTEFPQSKFRTDAQIRLASLSLRLNNPRRTVELLEGTRPRFRGQREEYLLLRAAARFQLGDYDRAFKEYQTFGREFGDSPRSRQAQFGLAWTRLRRGDSIGAQREFDSLATGTDSLAFAGMYESGILSLLRGDANAALSRFDTLVAKTPYDRYADQAYYQMGLARYRAKNYREARHHFQLAARLYPDSPLRIDAFHMLGEASMALRDFANAQYGFSKVKKLGGTGAVLANALFQEGVALYHLGRFRSCADRFEEFLQRFPKEGRVSYALVWKGEALYQDAKFEEAERSYADALKLLSNSAKRQEGLYGYAWTLFEQKKFSQAAAAFERFTNSYPGSDLSLEASLRKADCYFFLGQYEKSGPLYEVLAKSKSESRTVEYAAFQLAMTYIQRGEIERGIDHLRDFLLVHPASIYAEVVQFNIGWTYFSKGRFPEAVAEFRIVQQRYPESQLMPRLLFNTGDAFFNLKNYDSARVYYQRVINGYPTTPLVTDALAGLQYTYQAEGKPTQALAEIDTFLTRRPAGIAEEELFMRKGDILFDQGEFGAAVQEYRHILSLKPNAAVESRAWHQLGRAYELQNDPSHAVQCYEKVISDFPDAEGATAARLALGIVQIKAKQFRAAAASLQGFEKRYPDSPLLTEVHYQLGIALMNIPDDERALIQFRSVIESAPDNIFADRSRLQMAHVLTQRKDYKISLDTLDALLRRRSDDLAAEGLIMIGETHVAQKKYREALQAYHDVIEQYKDFPVQVERARVRLGEAYEKMKDRKQARLAYEEIFKSPVDPAVQKDVEQRLKRLKK